MFLNATTKDTCKQIKTKIKNKTERIRNNLKHFLCPQILKVKTNILILTRKNGKQNKTLTANENNFQTEMAKKYQEKFSIFSYQQKK